MTDKERRAINLSGLDEPFPNPTTEELEDARLSNEWHARHRARVDKYERLSRLPWHYEFTNDPPIYQPNWCRDRLKGAQGD